MTTEGATALGPDQSPVADPDRRVSGASKGRFYLGLLGLTVVILLTTLAVMAVLPALIPGWRSVLITSGSMEPAINAGDVVIASPHEGTGLGPGTVIVFDDPAADGLTTHRIAKVNADGSYVTQGDANRGPDSTPVHPDQVVGVGRILVPIVALPAAWARTGNWLAMAFGLAVIAVSFRTAAFAVLPQHNPWREDEDVPTPIERPAPYVPAEPEPVVVSPAWRTIATADMPEAPDEIADDDTAAGAES